MSLQKYVIQNIVGDQDIIAIYGHSIIPYIPFIIIRISLLGGILFVQISLQSIVSSIFLSTLFAIISIILYALGVIRFLDIYLDVLVLTESGIFLCLRNGLFTNSTQSVGRSSVQSIQESQQGIYSTFMQSGHIEILFQGGSLVFHNIHMPADVRQHIVHYQNSLLHEQTDQQEKSQFDMLVETLSDIINKHYDHTDDDIDT